MQLFAILYFIRGEENTHATDLVVQNYLTERLNSELTAKFFNKYKKYLSEFKLYFDKKKQKKKISVYSVKLLTITQKINQTLTQKEKYLILLRAIEFLADEKMQKRSLDFLDTLSEALFIEKTEYLNILFFVLEKYDEIPVKENLLIIKGLRNITFPAGTKELFNRQLDAPIVFLFLKELKTFIFRYYGKILIRLNVRPVKHKVVYHFDSGSIIRGERLAGIYQSELVNLFLQSEDQNPVSLIAKDIQFTYKKSTNGIKKVSFDLHSGELVGVIGSSGVGKSTFLNLLSGKLKLDKGNITINGYDLHKHQDKLKGLIGYVPQDDLLIEELTVYENLYYNAKLSFADLTEEEIKQEVEKTLKDLNIYDIKDQKVGTVLNRNISGGQRKRLNIALELIREPAILFIDEPTSGLSSTDSTILMHHLKQLTIRGKLIITNIHQPSSEIYKLFNKIIVIDKGGYVVYIGNPIEAIWYFKELSHHADADFVECPTCGNVRPEEVLEIIEEKIISETGQITNQRKTSPYEWYLLYKSNIERKSKILKAREKTKLPENKFKPPGILRQLAIFFRRNLHSKIRDIQYLSIAILEAPLLALILAFFSKKIIPGKGYVFMENNNLPVYLFMSIVVAMFLGLMMSAEEIVRDRKILERERFLNLSRFSYLFSKVITLFIFSAVQMLLFVLIGNGILEIKSLFWDYWILLFTTAAVSNIIGLNISASFKSVVAIYIMIPIVLVPQMLLGGAMIKFEDMHPVFQSKKYTPVIADLMISRWAYEAIAVKQFAENDYEKHFFQLDKKHSYALYIMAFWSQEMEKYATEAFNAFKNNDTETFQNDIELLKNEINRFKQENFVANLDICPENIDFSNFDTENYQKFITLINTIKNKYKVALQTITSLKDKKIKKLADELGEDGFIKLRKQNYNRKLEDIVLNRSEIKFISRVGNQLIRKKDPVFTDPYSKYGRAHFYAYEKFLGNKTIKTFIFNILVLWLFAIFLFIALYFDWFLKINNFFVNLAKNFKTFKK